MQVKSDAFCAASPQNTNLLNLCANFMYVGDYLEKYTLPSKKTTHLLNFFPSVNDGR